MHGAFVQSLIRTSDMLPVSDPKHNFNKIQFVFLDFFNESVSSLLTTIFVNRIYWPKRIEIKIFLLHVCKR